MATGTMVKFSRPPSHRKEKEETADNERRHSAADDDAFTCRPFALSLSPLPSARPSFAMINTRVYIRARAPRLQLCPVVREETRVCGEREKGSGREEEEANRWIERTVCARVEARSDERKRRREGDRKRSTRGSEKRNDKAARSAARWFGLTAVKKGKERREKVEVCCAAVGTDCRASEHSSLSSPSPSPSRLPALALSWRPRRACRLSLCRIRPPRGLSLYRAPSRHREDFSDPSSPSSPSSPFSPFLSSRLVIPRVREEKDRARMRFPSSSSPSLSGDSSPDRLYRPVDFSSAFRDRASRWSSAIAATGAHAFVHTYTRRTRRGALFPRRTTPFFERARPRFLADFIPIPRNKLADDHGGICLLGDLFFPLLSPFAPDLCCSLDARTIFFSRFRKVHVPRV